MTKYFLLFLSAPLWAAIGDNSPAIPSGLVKTHPVLPNPDATYLTNIWKGPGATGTCPAGNLPPAYANAISGWSATSPVGTWNARALAIGYLASANAGCANTTWLNLIKTTSSNLAAYKTNDSFACLGAAVLYDWTFSALDSTSKSNYLTFLETCATNIESDIYSYNFYNSNMYTCSSGSVCHVALMYVVPVIFPDDATRAADVHYLMDLWVNMIIPAWKQEFGPQGGGRRESWNGYVAQSGGQEMSWVFSWSNIWNVWQGLSGGANDWFTNNTWLKNWAYWSMRMVRPDFTWDKWGDEAKPYMTAESDLNGGNSSGGPSSSTLNMGTLAGLGEVYNDSTLRSWARIINDNATPNGFEPSGWPYFVPDNAGTYYGSNKATHDRTSLTLVSNLAGIGRIIGRTGWTENDSYWAFNWGGVNHWSHEDNGEIGAFTIFDRGSLAINAGTYQAGYASYHHLDYAMQGAAHNIVTVTDSADFYNSETIPFDNPDGTHEDNQPLPNDGGPRRTGSPYNGFCYGATPNTGVSSGCSSTGGTQALTLDSSMQALVPSGPSGHDNIGDKGWLDRSTELFQMSNLLTYVASPNETAPKYIYAAVNLAPAYNNTYSVIPAASTTNHRIGSVNRTNRVQRYIRHFLAIPRGTATYYVVFDDIKSTNSSFTKKWNLHTINQPTVTSSTFTVTRSDNAYILPFCSTWQQWSNVGGGAGQITNYSQGGGICQYQYAGKLYGFNASPSAVSITCVGGVGHESDVGSSATACPGTISGGTNYNNCSSTGQCGGSDQAGYPAGSGTNGIGNGSAVVPYTGNSGSTYPTAPLEPGGWRIEETPSSAATQDAFINVMLATSTADTNTVSTAPTESTSCGSYTGSTSCYTVSWKDNSNTCTYTVTFPQHGSGGFVNITGAGCSATVNEDIQTNACPSCSSAGFAVAGNTWTTQPTNGFQVQAFGFDKFTYASSAGKVVGGTGYDFYASDDQQAFMAYDFASNYWTVLDVGNQNRTDHIQAAGHPVGALDYDPARGLLVDYGGIGTNTGRDGRIWQYDLLGQTGRDKPTTPNTSVDLDLACSWYALGDYFLCVLPSGGTWSWTPDKPTNTAAANVWTKIYGLGLGGLPSANLSFISMATRSIDGKVYLFGGCAFGFTTCSNTIYRWDGNATGWTALSPTGTAPTAAWKVAWVYDRDDDIFLAVNGENGSGLLVQNFAYHPDTNAWETLSPTGTIGDGQAHWRMAYDSQNKVFVYLAAKGGSNCYNGDTCANFNSGQTYFFRYGTNAGPNGGTITQPNNFAPLGINNTIESSQPTGWAFNQSLAPGGSNLYACWSESGLRLTQNTTANLIHPYCSQWSGSAWTSLTSSTTLETGAYDFGHVATGYTTVPWTAWPQEPTSGGTTNLKYAFDTAGTWTIGTVGIGATCGGNSANCYPWNPKYLFINSVLHLAFLELDHSSDPWLSWGWVKTWNGSAWSNKGSALNINTGTMGDFVSSIDITSDGTNPFVAIVEGANTFETAGTMTAPQVYAQKWTGTAWAQVGTNPLNIDTTNGWAQDVAIAYMGGQPYVAWTEKGTTTPGTTTADKPAQLYLKTYNGTSWSQPCSGSLNSDPTFGYAFRPSLTVVGTVLYISWSEQQNLGKRSVTHVKSWNGTSCAFAGGALNQDTINGSSQGAALNVYNSQPAAIWGEVQYGGTRVTYASTLSNGDWVLLQPTSCAITPTALGPWTNTQVISQTLTESNCGASTFALTGAWPTGLSGCSTGAGPTCTVSGTISATGTFTPTVTYSSASNAYSIVVNAVPSITTSCPLPGGTQNASYSQTMTASGGTAPLSWSISAGSLPAGLSLTSNGVLSGIPTGTGTNSFTLKVSDTNAIAATLSCLLTISASGGGGQPVSIVTTGGTALGVGVVR